MSDALIIDAVELEREQKVDEQIEEFKQDYKDDKKRELFFEACRNAFESSCLTESFPTYDFGLLLK